MYKLWCGNFSAKIRNWYWEAGASRHPSWEAQLRDPSNLSDITALWYKERFIILWYIEGFIKEGPYYLFMNIYIIY